MNMFKKKVRVYEIEGDRAAWKAARAKLKQGGISHMEASFYESELPVCGCGPKIDHRNYGPNGWIDRRIYYIAVNPEDEVTAKALLQGDV